MWGTWEIDGQIARTKIEFCIASLRRLTAHGKLAAHKKTIGCGARGPEQAVVESVQIQFTPLGVLAPGNEEAPAARVIGLREEAEPVEIPGFHGAVGQRPEACMKVGCMVEGMTLHKDGDTGQGAMARGQMMEVGVCLPADVGEGDGGVGVGGVAAFVIDRDFERTWHPAQPAEVLGVAGDDELKRRRHGRNDTPCGRRGETATRIGRVAPVMHNQDMQWISRKVWDRLGVEGTDVHRVAAGGGGYLDRFGDWVVWSGADAPAGRGIIREMIDRYGLEPRGYLARELVRTAAEQRPAVLLEGEDPGTITVSESGVRYLVQPAGGYSTGLFLDQRMNRGWVRGLRSRRVLNLFAYTGSFSVCSALSGAATWSVDASKRALARARENFEANGLDPTAGHHFLVDDVMKVVPRLVKRGEKFDFVVLDPPTFGRADGRVFRIERDLSGLVQACYGLLGVGGRLLVSCNYAAWNVEHLGAICREALVGEQCEFGIGELPPEMERGAVSWRIRRCG